MGRYLLILLFSIGFIMCSSDGEKNPVSSVFEGYDLEHPVKTLELPDTLREISGLTNIDSTTFACVQDENGILFIYSASENKIIHQYRFNMDGDYEGIAKVGTTMYVLRSDGVLFEIENFAGTDFKLNNYSTGIPAENNEGLCYDSIAQRLLIACKSKIGKGEEFKDKRMIYAFNLKTKKLDKDPAFSFDMNDIQQFAKEKNVKMPERTSKNGRVYEVSIKFRTSAIGIHPRTGDLFLLSANDHMLFTFNMNGSIKNLIRLNEKVFNKSEGLTFYENGDLLITNEGQGKKPTLLKFRYQP